MSSPPPSNWQAIRRVAPIDPRGDGCAALVTWFERTDAQSDGSGWVSLPTFQRGLESFGVRLSPADYRTAVLELDPEGAGERKAKVGLRIYFGIFPPVLRKLKKRALYFDE